MTLTENHINAFTAIKNFVEDLWTVHKSKTVTPLALYQRILTHINVDDLKNAEKAVATEQCMNKAISGFVSFFSTTSSKDNNLSLNDLERGSRIVYGDSDKIFIEIEKFIRTADEDVGIEIRRHVITIYSFLEQDSEKIKKANDYFQEMSMKLAATRNANPLDALKALNIDENSPEGKMLGGMLGKVTDVMKDVDMSNPMASITGLMTSGALNDIMGAFTGGVDGGEGGAAFNPSSMKKLMTGLLNTLIPDEPPAEEKPSTSTVDISQVD